MTRTGIGSISKSTTASHVTLLIHPRWQEGKGSGSTRARWRWQGFHPHLFRSKEKRKKVYFSRRVGVELYRAYGTDNCDGPGWLNILRQCLCNFESTMPPFRKKTAERTEGGSLSIGHEVGFRRECFHPNLLLLRFGPGPYSSSS